MFYITLRLDNANYSGLEALDLRRRLGLPDGNQLYFHGDTSQRIEVSEGFARAYFGTSEVVSIFVVPVSLLAKGDVKIQSDQYPDTVNWSEEISPERARELWLAARDYA